MTHALMAPVDASYAAGEHPHAPAGSPKGGQFAPTGGGGKTPAKKPARRGTAPAHHGGSGGGGHATRSIPNGALGFDGAHGTGYGVKGGNPQVNELQVQLNRLGFKDANGSPLAKDGKFGPKTTAAVEAAQRKLGMKPNGIITPAFIARLQTLKDPARKAPARKPAARKPAPKKAAAAGAKPYGNVMYADPGYQDDGKARYPLDTAAHCRAAWSYINQSDNAAQYSAHQVEQIKAKILAAGKKYGIDFTTDGKVTAGLLTDIELARPGTWSLASGEQTFTTEMLQDAARYAAKHADDRPSPLKLGHSDPRFDGEPAFGWLRNADIYFDTDAQGPVLKARQLAGMPDWLAAAAPDAWPDRSVEGWLGYTDADGEEFGFIVDGLALLGVTPPGMSSIRTLRDLPQALGVAAAARVPARIVARAPAPESPALDADEEPNQEGAGMDPARIREALGLSADASDDEVRNTFSAALPTDDDDGGTEVQASLLDELDEDEKPASRKTKVKSAPLATGEIRVDASAWQEQQDRIKRLERVEARRRVEERDSVIAEAVRAGKFAPSRREHWVRMWDADAEGARQVIAGLQAGLIPVAASGYSDSEGADLDAEFAHLFPPQSRPESKGGLRRG